MGNDYRDKIRKLLTLAESPNEHEAKSALLKARQLMAEHKLTEQDCQEMQGKRVQKTPTNMTCSKRRFPWMVQLSIVIGENYCCQAFMLKKKGKQTRQICFIGLEDDIDICLIVFQYAVDCIMAGIHYLAKQHKPFGQEYVNQMCNSYGFGFIAGIRHAFQKQKEEHQSWGLVLTVPQAVIAEAEKMGPPQSFEGKASRNLSRSAFQDGYVDGKKFDPTKRIAG